MNMNYQPSHINETKALMPVPCIQFELKFTHIFNTFYANQQTYKLPVNDVSDMGSVVWLS